MLDYLQQDPGGFLLFMLYRAPAVLLALTLHELAHGYMALRSGDPTAQMMGRLTLNPLKHLDPIGTLSLFLLGFGWAKPVPVNPANFRRGRRDDLLVSLAGVTVNFLLFLVMTMLAIPLGHALYTPQALQQLGGFRFFLAFGETGYTMQLFPEYAGTLSVALKTPWLLHLQRFVLHSCMINLGLTVFNLLPIPPLDGFHVFNDILLGGRLKLSSKSFRIAQAGLMILLFTTNVVGSVVSFLMNNVQAGVLTVILPLLGGG